MEMHVQPDLPAYVHGIRQSLPTRLGISPNKGYLSGGPHHKDYSILRSIILGSPYLRKLRLTLDMLVRCMVGT